MQALYRAQGSHRLVAGFGVAAYSANRGDSGGSAAGAMAYGKSSGLRERLEAMRAQMESERSSFKSHWQDLNDFILPRRARFFTSDANKGDRRNLKILDDTPTLAARSLKSGMMAGITSPARPWFRLTTPDPDLAEIGAVKAWLHAVTQRMAAVFIRSNLYNALPIIYGDMGVFGTACMSVEEDFQSVVRFYPFPIGSYMIANNDRLQVETFFREFRMTVRQLVDRFGRPFRNAPDNKIDWTKISDYIRNAYMDGHLETWVDVCHTVFTNEDYDPRKAASQFKKYRSIYYEKGSSSGGGSYLRDDKDRILSDKGFDYFPILAPRWEITGEDVYGTESPGMAALGDAKQLQTGEKRGLQAVEKMINPPMTGPTSMRSQKASILPGDINYVDVREGQKGFQPAHEVNYNLQQHELKQDQVRGRIRRAFFEDLFLMLAADNRNRQVTAREVEERHEEKLLALGPVLEQLNQDLLDPLIDITFTVMLRQGLLPEPPEELRGVDLRVEYISIMAQAQKLVGLGGLERYAAFAQALAATHPDSVDKTDADQLLDTYGDLTSVPPGVIRPDEQVSEIRAARAQQMQAAAAAEAMKQSASTAKDLSQAKLDDDSALSRIAQAAEGGSVAPAI